MRHKYRRRPESEMLVVHQPRPTELANGNDTASPREARKELAALRARALETSDPAERESLLAEIRDRFGNEAVGETVARMRSGSEDDS